MGKMNKKLNKKNKMNIDKIPDKSEAEAKNLKNQGKINKKLNKKNKMNIDKIGEKSDSKDLKNQDNDNSKNILPMKLQESPRPVKKNKAKKKTEIKLSNSLSLNLSENDSPVTKNKKKKKSKKVIKSENNELNDEHLNKNKIAKNSGEVKVTDNIDETSVSQVKPETQNDQSKIKENIEKNERTIFIGNLPPNIKQKQLENLLLPYGKLLKCRFRLPNMGKPILKHKMAIKAGCLNGYAELSSIEEAENALKLNGIEYKGHRLRVTKSTEKFNPNAISPEQVKCTIFVGNLKYSANDDALYNIFSSCGEIEYCRTLNNAKGCKGVAYVCFKNPHSIGLSLELNGTLLEDRPITVTKYSLNKIKQNRDKGPKEEPKVNGFMRRVMKKFIKDEKVDADTILDKRRMYNKNKTSKDSEKYGNKKMQNKKKIEFRGVEVKSKKKFKSKPRGNKMLKDLAKKIAPK